WWRLGPLGMRRCCAAGESSALPQDSSHVEATTHAIQPIKIFVTSAELAKQEQLLKFSASVWTLRGNLLPVVSAKVFRVKLSFERQALGRGSARTRRNQKTLGVSFIADAGCR